MAIGFKFDENEKNSKTPEVLPEKVSEIAVKSVVSVDFGIGREYSYYNDRFDLKVGDKVYVEGKLEGKIGTIESVSTHFKVSLANYKKVIAKIDTDFHGTFKCFGGVVVSTDEKCLEFEQFKNWVIPPNTEDDFVSGEGFTVDFDTLQENDEISQEVFQRGIDYLNKNYVKYISIRNGVGHAFVEGSEKYYQIDFQYNDGVVEDLLCDCFCVDLCKHCVAVLLLLKIMYESPDNDFFDEYKKTKSLTVLDFNMFFEAKKDKSTIIV